MYITDLKTGATIELDGQPYEVIESQRSKVARQKAVQATKLRDLITGQVLQKSFSQGDKIIPADLNTITAQFLYLDPRGAHFMDQKTFEEIPVPLKIVEDKKQFLKEGQDIELVIFADKPVAVKLPIKLKFKVIEAPPAVRGNTADGGSKQVTVETGLKVTTPLFIKEGDVIVVDTRDGSYAERG